MYICISRYNLFSTLPFHISILHCVVSILIFLFFNFALNVYFHARTHNDKRVVTTFGIVVHNLAHNAKPQRPRKKEREGERERG